MKRGVRAFLTITFVAAVGAGAWVLTHPERLSPGSELMLPPLLVAAYALMVFSCLRDTHADAALEHYSDSIYFLGFMLTLVSLITLFYRLQSELGDVLSTAGISGLLIERSFSHVGVAVSTSLAGILLRNIVRGLLLAADEDPAGATGESSEEDLALLRQRETEYVQALETFVSSTGAFSEGLATQQEQLGQRLEEMAVAVSRHEEVLSGYAELGRALVRSAERVQELADSTSLRELNQELAEFHRGVSELNLVLDGVIGVLEQKVECVR